MNDSQSVDRDKTSEELLADEIVLKLIENGLIREKKKNDFVNKLANDQLTKEDWGLEIELSTEGGNNDDN